MFTSGNVLRGRLSAKTHVNTQHTYEGMGGGGDGKKVENKRTEIKRAGRKRDRRREKGKKLKVHT